MSSDRRRSALMLVISSPSGAGKTSMTRRLAADHAELALSISMTTRSPRPGEMDGREYHFVDHQTFTAMAKKGEFLEWAQVHEHSYGTPKTPVTEAIAAGRDIIFDIDWQGAQSVHRTAPEDVVRVFILPPTMAEMSRRLHARAQDAEDVIQRRLERAKGEIIMWPDYDYVVLNDDFDLAYAELAHIYHAERLKRARNPWIGPFVDGLVAEEI